MEKLLVLRGGALGDFIVTLPALALLRARWPKARIELAGNATAAQLALNRGLIDAVHSQHEARWAALYDDGPLPREFGAWLDEFDLVISFWPDPDGELRQRFPRHQRHRAAHILPSPRTVIGAACSDYGSPRSRVDRRNTARKRRFEVREPDSHSPRQRFAKEELADGKLARGDLSAWRADFIDSRRSGTEKLAGRICIFRESPR
jgi:hypothetical protein